MASPTKGKDVKSAEITREKIYSAVCPYRGDPARQPRQTSSTPPACHCHAPSRPPRRSHQLCQCRRCLRRTPQPGPGGPPPDRLFSPTQAPPWRRLPCSPPTVAWLRPLLKNKPNPATLPTHHPHSHRHVGLVNLRSHLSLAILEDNEWQRERPADSATFPSSPSLAQIPSAAKSKQHPPLPSPPAITHRTPTHPLRRLAGVMAPRLLAPTPAYYYIRRLSALPCPQRRRVL